MKHFFILFLLTTFISLHAEVIEELKWIPKLSKQDQQIVTLMLRNKLNKHLTEVVASNVKTTDDYAWLLTISSFGMHYLSELSTKDNILKNKFIHESDIYADRLNGKTNEEKFRRKQAVVFEEISKIQYQINEAKFKSVFNQFHKELDKSSNAFITFSKMSATQYLLDNKKPKEEETIK